MESKYINLFRDLLVNPQSTLKSLKQVSLQSAFIYFYFCLGCICRIILPCRVVAESLQKY